MPDGFEVITKLGTVLYYKIRGFLCMTCLVYNYAGKEESMSVVMLLAREQV